MGLVLCGLLILYSLMCLSGSAALQAWRGVNNPILYADRFAFPDLFPNNRIISHLRDLYPYLSIVYSAPALMLQYLGIPSNYVTFVEVAINDPLMALVVYWLSRVLGMARETSLLAALFTLASRVLSWDLGGYEYYGHDFAYSGALYLPFAVAVIPSLISGRIRLALVFAAIAALVFAPAGALMTGVVFLFLLARHRDGTWRSAMPWFGLPLLALASAAVVQLVIAGRITERFTDAEDLAVVMANGHFVPLWISGQVFASTYLGFFLWCGLGVLAARRWRDLTPEQRLPIAILAGMVLAGFAAALLAVQQGWPFILRLGLFRYAMLLTIVAIPLIVGDLVERMRSAAVPTRVVAVLLFVLMAIDRGTAWMLPLMLPCVALLAVSRRLGPVLRWVGPVVAAACVILALDVLLHGGIAEWMSGQFDPTGRAAPLFAEASRRLWAGGVELWLLPLVGIPWLLARVAGAGRLLNPDRGSLLVSGLCLFVFACVVSRSATNAVWAATGPPSQFAEAQRWAREFTPPAAKFVFLEIEPNGSYPSWQTLSQRGAAEMQYTHQKVYLPDRQLLDIDKAVSAYYGFDPAAVDDKLYPFYALDLQKKYQQFSAADFRRVTRLSGSNFIVLKKPRRLGFPVAFENALFAVFRAPAQFVGVTVTAGRVGERSIELSWDGAETPRPGYRVQVEFREARSGRVTSVDCCVTIGMSAGKHTFYLPTGLSGSYLAMVGVTDAVTGARRPLEGDASGEHLAFWEYLVTS